MRVASMFASAGTSTIIHLDFPSFATTSTGIRRLGVCGGFVRLTAIGGLPSSHPRSARAAIGGSAKNNPIHMSLVFKNPGKRVEDGSFFKIIKRNLGI
jgi:hypothetical protein